MNFKFFSKRKGLYLLEVFFLAMVFLFSIAEVSVAAPITREYTIKASLILKFTDFIKFPETSVSGADNSTYDLCLLGGNPFGSIFSQAKKEGILKKNIFTHENASDSVLKKCDIIFLAGGDVSNLNRALRIIRDRPTLIIAEAKGFAELGAGINFVVKNNKIKFEINRPALKRKGIEVSSYLLNIAILVGGAVQ
jgi:hypothetical protein